MFIPEMILQLFVNNVLPAFIVIGFGALLTLQFELDLRTVSRITLYVLTPCLVFSSLLTTKTPGGEASRTIQFLIAITIVVGIISWAIARLLQLDRQVENALLLSTMFSNAGNMGLSVLLFAYGQPGVEAGVIYYVGSALMNHTIAAYFASRGQASVRRSFLNVLQLPALYGAIAALTLRALQCSVPPFILKPTSLVGNAAVPTLLLMLGMQLARTHLQNNIRLIALATFIKLILTAGVSFLLADLLGLTGLTRAVCIAQASMPTAVTTIMMSIEFEANPQFVTGVVFLSTLLSSVSLTLIFAWLH